MKKSEIEALFIETAGLKLYNKLSPLQKLTIDEAIDHIVNGTAKINDHAPETPVEILTVIINFFEFSNKVLPKVVKGLFESEIEPDTVTLNYRGKEFVYQR